MAHDPVVVVLNDWGSVVRALETTGAYAVEAENITDLKAMLKCADAMVLTGGSDIEPSRYNAEKHPKSGGFALNRDKLEFEAVKLARKHRVPIMGICRGHQLLNVAHGGSLIQHLGDHPHSLHHEGSSHGVNLRKESQIGAVLGSYLIEVTSLHHQAVGRMGDGLVPVGWADDGTVEMFESAPGTKPYILGTQFHPEVDYTTDIQARAIFSFFVEKVRTRARGRGRFQKRREAILEIARAAKQKNKSFSNYTPLGYSTHGYESAAGYGYSSWPGVAWDNDLSVVESQWNDDWSLLDQHTRKQEDVNEVLDMQDWRKLNDAALAEVNRCEFPPCSDPKGCATYGDCEKGLMATVKSTRGNPRKGRKT